MNVRSTLKPIIDKNLRVMVNQELMEAMGEDKQAWQKDVFDVRELCIFQWQ